MTIQIAGQPILVDLDGEAQSWLDRFMPESCVFKPPQVAFDEHISGPNGTGALFKSSLPELPAIKIGQIQWPCVGASRYARGLFLVDRIALFEILSVAWGHTARPETFPQAIPDDWAQTRNRPVSVTLTPGGSDAFSIWMYLLLPIRISDDLWILPLVDGRYFRLTDCKPNTALIEDGDYLMSAPTETWQDIFSGFSTEPIDYAISVTYWNDAVAAMGHPDTVFANPQVPTPFIVDAACFSIGRRPVVPYPTYAQVNFDFPSDSTLRVLCQKHTGETPIKTATLANSKITGGLSGSARRPRSLNVSTRLSREFYTGTNESWSYKRRFSTSARNGIDLFCKAVWNTIDDETASMSSSINESKTAFHEYVDAIVLDLREWLIDEYYVVFPDVIRIEPGGFDDYIIYELSGDKKTTTVRSLPIDFAPPFLLAQSPSGAAFDNHSTQVKWFRTNNQTCVATVSEEIPASTTSPDGLRGGERGKAIIHHPSLAFGDPWNRAEVYVIASETTGKIAAGTLIHIAWVDDSYANGVKTHWVVDWPECSERLERFTMLSEWQGTNALASFRLATAAGIDQYGILEDPEGIFTDQIGYGNTGLSIRTCNGRHFVIQAKCDQESTPPAAPMGSCAFSGPDGDPQCAMTTEAACNAIPGTWTFAGTCR